MGVAWKNTFTGLVTLLICSNLIVAEAAKKAAPNDAADLTSDHSEEDNEPLAVKVTKWLDSVDGGYFNAKQEVRPVNDAPEGEEAFYGIFAKESIAKGEMLAEIPWDIIINEEEADPTLSEEDNSDALRCGTARNLAKEMKQVQTLGKYVKDPSSASKLGPYIQYLLEKPKEIIPSTWSLKGRGMLKHILGGEHQSVPPLYATTWLEEDWYGDCNGDPNDELASRAAMLVVSRADDDLLVPVYDMYNHRNGKYYNTHMKVTRGVSYQVTARRDIEAGEQLYNSYNMCDNCGGRTDGYGTPEMFRDYGFVEDFPQRWLFEQQEFQFDLSESGTGEMHVTWKKDDKPDTDEEKTATKQLIMKELQRLVKKRNQIWKAEFHDGKSSIKESEWNSLWEFHQAMVNALTYAFNDIVEDDSELLPVGKDTCTSDGVCGIDYFDNLEEEEDKIKYNVQTCDNEEIMEFPDYFMLEGLKTHYQELNFAYREEGGDICMDLEDTVQICSDYRPHYHEFSSHFAARFIDNVKNVVFVGGGDSMMLHEVLKYPSLEKVIGLELDQTVVRKSFKYFRTQPHFDNDKVEWWFGDATKSLLLLPEDYWGAFDLVIVDLSETVMSFSVTDELDVFDALALLLNQDGVMVKNEHYMKVMSKTFDYTLQVYLDGNPNICSQCMIFGSNKADFFHKPLVEHGVETLLLPAVAKLEDQYDYFHDFRKNNATEQGKCDLKTEKEKPAEQIKSAGLLHILDAEDVGVTLDNDTVEKIIIGAAKEEGFTKIESDDKLAKAPKITQPSDSTSTVVNVAFKEGYASARIWPELNYVAVDVGVWGSFQNGDKFRQRIAKSLKAKTASFFRVVVGGMYGSSTWEQDRDVIGPQIVQQRNCEAPEDVELSKDSTDAKNEVFEEAANFFASGENTVAAVFCGLKGVDKCSSVDILKQNPSIGVIPVWACPELMSGDNSDKAGKFAKMTKCEEQVLSTLMTGRGRNEEGIELIVLDESTPREMGQILHSILTEESHHDLLMSEFEHNLISLSKNLDSERWRANLFERIRKEILYDPVKVAQYDINADGEKMILDMVSLKSLTFKGIKEMEMAFNDVLGVSANVVAVTGGLFNFQHDFDPHYYTQEDYPLEPGDKQWEAQKSLGRKTVVQYDKIDGGKMPEPKAFVEVIAAVLSDQKLYSFEVYTDVGDGVLVVSDSEAGSLVAVWDGRDHIDLSIFMHDDNELEMGDLIHKFKKLTKEYVAMGLRDDFPRGTGRVMNFKADMTYAGFDPEKHTRPYVDHSGE